MGYYVHGNSTRRSAEGDMSSQAVGACMSACDYKPGPHAEQLRTQGTLCLDGAELTHGKK